MSLCVIPRSTYCLYKKVSITAFYPSEILGVPIQTANKTAILYCAELLSQLGSGSESGSVNVNKP